MQNSTRNEAHLILDKLPETKLSEALTYLKLLEILPQDKLDAIEDLMENLGWTLLSSEVAKKDWE